LGRRRQENLEFQPAYKFEASLGYLVRPWLKKKKEEVVP
jgi:hypothetical protein